MSNKYKPSAYRSGLIVKQYKNVYKDFYKSNNADIERAKKEKALKGRVKKF
jgi:hypothetical protein